MMARTNLLIIGTILGVTLFSARTANATYIYDETLPPVFIGASDVVIVSFEDVPTMPIGDAVLSFDYEVDAGIITNGLRFRTEGLLLFLSLTGSSIPRHREKTIILNDLLNLTADGQVDIRISDELSNPSGWNVENLRLTYEYIPEPTTFSLTAIALLGILTTTRIRRRETEGEWQLLPLENGRANGLI